MKRIRAFTLIELLIATLIFSIIILSVYSAFQTGILSYRKIDSAFNVYQTTRIVLSRIELDLKNSFTYSEGDSRFKGTAQTLDFLSVIDSFEKGEMSSNVSHIKYELSNGILKRTCYQDLDAIKDNFESPIETELSSDVREISFKYAYATNDPAKPYDWQDSWPKEGEANQLKTLPLAVKVKLSLIERDRKQKEVGVIEFIKTISLPLGE